MLVCSNLGRLCRLLHLSNSHASLTLEESNNPIRIENDFEIDFRCSFSSLGV